jgi:hypothetical protein
MFERNHYHDDDYMVPDGELTDRLTRLIELLDGTHAASTAAVGESHGNRLDHTADERIRALTAMLGEGLDRSEMSVEDALLMRLLLDDYGRAVRHVRAVASETDTRLNDVATVLKEGYRAVDLARAHADTADPPTEA